MVRLLLLISASVIALATPCLAEYEFHPITTDAQDSERCSVAANPYGEAVVAWSEGGQLHSRSWTGGALGAVTDHGASDHHTVAWTEEGFWLAWVDAAGIWLRQGDGAVWGSAELLVPVTGPALYLPRLTGDTPPHPDDDLYLTFSDADGTIWFYPRHDGEWWWQIIPMATVASGMPIFSKAVSNGGGYEIYFSTDVGVYVCTGIGTYELVGVPDGLAGQFDAALDPDLGEHVLGNGIQPVCPCNLMLHTSRSGDITWPPVEWSPLYDLTYDYDSYSWPHNPAIAFDGDGVLHASWDQQHFDGSMNPTMRGVFYYQCVDGVWSDAGDLLQGYGVMARDVHMALGAQELPVFAFVRDEAPHFNVWLALDPIQTAAPDTPAAVSRLSVWPNPFNPKTTIRYEAPGPVEVTVHDVSGRLLRTLFDGVSDGELQVDWNGRDDAGFEQPSGVYLLRSQGRAGVDQMKLVLIR